MCEWETAEVLHYSLSRTLQTDRETAAWRSSQILAVNVGRVEDKQEKIGAGSVLLIHHPILTSSDYLRALPSVKDINQEVKVDETQVTALSGSCEVIDVLPAEIECQSLCWNLWFLMMMPLSTHQPDALSRLQVIQKPDAGLIRAASSALGRPPSTGSQNMNLKWDFCS